MREESFTRLPAEIVEYAEREHPQVPIGEFLERALRRVGTSSAAEQKRLIALGLPYTNDLAGWVRRPYSIERGLWDGFADIVEKRKEHPGAMLAGSVMVEIGMS